MTMPPPIKTQGDPHQGLFDFAVGFRNRTFLTVNETVGVLRLNKDSVIALCDGRKLETHEHQITGTQKIARRITRRSVVAYLASTAQYKPDDWSESLLGIIDGLTDPALLARIAAIANARRSQHS